MQTLYLVSDPTIIGFSMGSSFLALAGIFVLLLLSIVKMIRVNKERKGLLYDIDSPRTPVCKNFISTVTSSDKLCVCLWEAREKSPLVVILCLNYPSKAEVLMCCHFFQVLTKKAI